MQSRGGQTEPAHVAACLLEGPHDGIPRRGGRIPCSWIAVCSSLRPSRRASHSVWELPEHCPPHTLWESHMVWEALTCISECGGPTWARRKPSVVGPSASLRGVVGVPRLWGRSVRVDAQEVSAGCQRRVSGRVTPAPA